MELDDVQHMENNRIPQEGEDINVPQNTTIVVKSKSTLLLLLMTLKNYLFLKVVNLSLIFLITHSKQMQLDIKGTIQPNHGMPQ